MSLYKQGIRFSCRKCGKCCVSAREDMCMYLFLPDIENIAAYLGVTKLDLVKKYCNIINDRFIFADGPMEIMRVELKKGRGGACVFLEEGLCRIYPSRPELCRLGPFTAGYMHSRKYFSLFKSICRGIGRGRLHPAGQIEGLLRQGQLLETRYERDLCTDPFLKTIFRTLPVAQKEIIIGRTYESYLNAED